ncbi:hypothetical protein O6H91_23G014700 [Diphasiastrum complanatum]|uniref:Uncharacterized protein n=1 Tax=Diphasiastrum complanatum TaxID=34168 RepID=A0ACC2A8M8_DIPCM|nr:hypothetical protein O6H91_23G014700 [Diphasiastrum complanatum]
MSVAQSVMAMEAVYLSAARVSARGYGSHATSKSPSQLRSVSVVAFQLSVFHKRFDVSIANASVSPAGFSRKELRHPLPISAAATQNLTPAVTLSENALRHLSKLREEQNKDLCLRIGVRQGGCSGMSYVMDFEERTNIRPDDSIIDNGGFTMVCDPKSLLFLFGMQLDYSDALIGGGFSFNNPNATSSCGCGKSFAA